MGGVSARNVLANAVSPYGLALFSYLFFLVACVLPPGIYSYYMQEPDLMFLDPLTILFYSGCVLSFVCGVWFVGWVSPIVVNSHKFEVKIPPVPFLLLPLIGSGMVAAISLIKFLHLHPEIIILLVSNQSASVKDLIAFDSEGDFTKATLLLIGIIWWVFWRSSDLKLSRMQRTLVRVVLVLGVLVVVAMSTVTLLRNFMMMALIGLVSLFIVRKILLREINARFLLKITLAIAAGVVLLFFGTSAVRGFTGANELTSQLLGYTLASYNRLSAILSGRLRYPFAGRGIYLSYIAAYNSAFNRIIPLGQILHAPEFLNLWGSEFTAVSQAGLNGGLIWAGTFGYIYSDLGWLSLAWVFLYGAAYALIWKSVLKGNVLGIFLYPFFAYCEVGWWGTNALLDSPLIIFVLSAVMFKLYEAIFLRRIETMTLAF